MNGVLTPDLYKQYGELCDDGGCRFVAFHVDRGFGHCIDGLIVVDVDRVTAGRRRRYMNAGI